eukprot:1137669-Pelagomonas_calceolata.AAC.6
MGVHCGPDLHLQVSIMVVSPYGAKGLFKCFLLLKELLFAALPAACLHPTLRLAPCRFLAPLCHALDYDVIAASLLGQLLNFPEA